MGVAAAVSSAVHKPRPEAAEAVRNPTRVIRGSVVERTWNKYASQGQISALACAIFRTEVAIGLSQYECGSLVGVCRRRGSSCLLSR